MAFQPIILWTDGVIFGLVFMMSAMGSGAMIMQNTITEKQSRIVEILLAAVPAARRMTAKRAEHGTSA